MTVAEQYPPPSQRRGSAIVFDPATQTVSTQKLKRVPGLSSFHLTWLMVHALTTLAADQVTSTQSAPKWNSHVSIYVQDDDTRRLAATLDLGKLGFTNNVMRLCGKFSQIVVMESSENHTYNLLQTS